MLAANVVQCIFWVQVLVVAEPSVESCYGVIGRVAVRLNEGERHVKK